MYLIPAPMIFTCQMFLINIRHVNFRKVNSSIKIGMVLQSARFLQYLEIHRQVQKLSGV